MVRYKRFLDDFAFEKLSGDYRFIIDDVREIAESDPYAIDIQLRENNQVMFYHGTTRLLVVEFSKNGTLKCSADKAYKIYDGSDNLFKEIWSDNKNKNFRKLFLSHLKAAIKASDSRYYRNGKEGYWQNLLSVYLGKEWSLYKEPLIIDREVALGFDHKDEKDAFYGGLRPKFNRIKNDLRSENSTKWGKIDEKQFGDELDFLALRLDNKIMAIELKHGSSASGIYWGPLQVGLYWESISENINIVSDGIKKLVQQKVDLGLLPHEAKLRVKNINLESCSAVLAVAEPNNKSTCWGMLDITAKKVKEVAPEFDFSCAKIYPRMIPELKLSY